MSIKTDLGRFEYVYKLLRVYYARPDLQNSYPEVAKGDLQKLLVWASYSARTEYPNGIGIYDYIYKLMRIYYARPDLQNSYPEAAGGNLKKLLDWASYASAEEAKDMLGDYEHIYKLMRIYYARPDLQNSYPEAGNSIDIKRLVSWVVDSGTLEESLLTPFASSYSKMRSTFL